MPLKEKVFLQVSLVDCKQNVVCSLVLCLKHGNICTDKSYKAEKTAISNVSTYTEHLKNHSEREGNSLQATSLCSLNFSAG